jgi:capsular exopolysaccharide synthesis family protein
MQFVAVSQGAKAVVVTSSVAEEGKTTTAINLAESYAQAGKSVLLVDADLRRPSLADYLGLEGAAGLTTVLIGEATIDEVHQVTGEQGVTVLTSGPTPPNPSELLASEAMSVLIKEMQCRYDVVILDTAPLLPVTDGAALAHLAGAAVLVLRAGRTTRQQLQASRDTLESAGAHLTGIVINRAARPAARVYGSYAPTIPTPKDMRTRRNARPPVSAS